MIRVICLLIGYVFGLFQTAYLYGRLHGIDIRTRGSGNAGTTNTLRVLGARAGVIVLFGDIVKTILAIAVVRIFIVPYAPELEYLLVLYTAAGAILGHNYPFYLGFKGGKGIAATAGLILSMNPWFVLVGLILFVGAYLLTHYVSLGSLLVYAGFIIQLVVMGEKGSLGNMNQAALNEMYLIGFLMTMMAYWKHRENIKRLLTRTERKTYLFKKVKGEEKS